MRLRLRHVRLAALLAVTALLVPGAAHAAAPQEFPLGGEAWATANAIAVAHWGATPCAGQVAIAWTALEPLTNARASWHNPTDPWGAPQTNFNCRVDFNASTAYDFPMLCTVLAHEIGHLLGRTHEGEGQLMSAIYSTPLPACASGDPTPAAPAAPAPAAAPAASTASAPAAARKTLKPAVKRAASCASQRAKSRRTKRCASRRVCVLRSANGRKVRRCTVRTASPPRPLIRR